MLWCMFPCKFNWGLYHKEFFIGGTYEYFYSLSSKNMVRAMSDLEHAWYYSLGRCCDPMYLAMTCLAYPWYTIPDYCR